MTQKENLKCVSFGKDKNKLKNSNGEKVETHVKAHLKSNGVHDTGKQKYG